MQLIRAAFGLEEQPVATCPGLRPMAERAQPPLVARWITNLGPVASATSPFLSEPRAAADWAAGRRSRCFTSCSCKWSLMGEVFLGLGVVLSLQEGCSPDTQLVLVCTRDLCSLCSCVCLEACVLY